eukprot:1160396-Pelagomonas_calceolata.AAC.9
MLHGVVGFVPNRVDGDQSVQAAVVSRLVKAGARVSKQLGSSTTHVVFLQKLLPSFQEQVQQDDLIKDLYERLEKASLNQGWENEGCEDTTAHSRDGQRPRSTSCFHAPILRRSIAKLVLCPTFGCMHPLNQDLEQM